ncbi:hypothetical protein R1flu_013923 [Riccia fluitans]|uniref:ADP-ribosylation factor n=1 Tax=Riccia fluitans TaxID=41844 RepID=A0ABD1YES0_9MARC
MGQLLATLIGRLVGPRELRILMLGLDAAGKTTVLYKLKLGESVCTIPTIGFNVETVQYKNINFTVWDGLIFVVDSADKERIMEARDELHSLLHDSELSRVTLLVLANKMDLPQAMSVAEMTDKLQLMDLRQTNWYIQSCCATSAQGLYEGLDWLGRALQDVGSRQ